MSVTSVIVLSLNHWATIYIVKEEAWIGTSLLLSVTEPTMSWVRLGTNCIFTARIDDRIRSKDECALRFYSYQKIETNQDGARRHS